ncbi:tripartite tricarboxylate transporter TctB family protein [Silicimonas algicola]|uniref:Tripartite tricarboxylate transporter TctB family protein n=1 Tax=Silicimonas algicola TaxID=1826607 RepID=A0A316GDX1_9RHOB|nr:tripartite tricarboxylate transporter TctB family protein [Silicimonas algicola]AZQ67978.1 tripartite tricarboxylate transporter TctB family protein [Silicimonas algicola]PWK57580.1 tripartite tricarboxylate transporter TctB family protein [Silicimonas algicola]
MDLIDPDHHDGTSDATPGGEPTHRRPGEMVFGLFLLGASLVLMWSAYGISGFKALSAPGTVPMATTAVMVVTAALVVLRTRRLPLDTTETVAKDILPGVVILVAALLVGYGLLLRPLGFLPTSALFLIVAIKALSRRGWGWTLGVSLGSLLVVWLIFRIVFSVLMPAGIVPEGEIIQVFRDLVGGSA